MDELFVTLSPGSLAALLQQVPRIAVPHTLNWVAVKELKLSYRHGHT